MRSLNREYRGLDRTTDVLSFPVYEGGPDEVRRALKEELALKGGPPPALGDIVISASKSAAQAAERGHGLMDEMVFLLVHGVLHLAGYDHEKGPEAARAMTRKHNDLVRRIGGAG